METIPEPLLTIPKTTQPPVIDGLFDEEAWASAAKICGLSRQSDAEPAEDYTEVRLTYDDEKLYLVLRCVASEEPRVGILEDWREHERVVVDFMVDAQYYAFRFNSSDGAEVTAPQGPPLWWGEGCQTKVRFDDKGWQFEVAIPFARFGSACPSVGATWGFNIDRQQRKRREDDSMWCHPYIGGDYHPERMGQIVFGGAEAGTCSVTSVGARQMGANSATLEICNRGKNVAHLAGQVSHGLAPQPIQISPAERRTVPLAYRPEADSQVLVLTVSDSATGNVLCRQGIALNLPPVKAALARISEETAALRAPDVRTQEAVRFVTDAAKDLTQQANAESVSREEWARLWSEVQALSLAVAKVRWRAEGAEPSRPYEVAVCGSTTSVFRDDFLPPTAQRLVELCACRNERECAQVVVLPIDADLQQVRVEATDLNGPEGRIAQHNIELSLVGYVEMKRTRYRQERLGWYPDPLLPLEPFDVPRDSLQPVWVAVYVPRGTPAGDYEGEIRVIPRNAPPLSVPVRLHVWDFELPLRPALRTSFALFEDQINNFYGWTGDPPQALRRQWYDLLLQRRIAPGCCYAEIPLPRIEDLDYCIQRGANAITLGYVPSDWQAKLDQIALYLDYLKQKGWYDLAWIYGFDEVGESGYARVRDIYGKVAQRFPGLHRAVTLGSVADPEPLAGAVDILIPETDRYRDHFKPMQRRGAEAWVYWSMWPRHPHANAFIDYPRMDQRVVFWQCWKDRVDGFMYYAINIWWTNYTAEPDAEGDSRVHSDRALLQAIREGKRFPEIPWNSYCGDGAIMGDGQLVYPGRNGRLLSSTRLEAMSQGIEDYDYLALLARLTDELRAADKDGKHAEVLRRCDELLAVRPEIVSDWTHYTRDPALLESERRAVAHGILAVQRLLGPHP